MPTSRFDNPMLAAKALRAARRRYPYLMRNAVEVMIMDGFHVGINSQLFIVRYSNDTERAWQHDDMQEMLAELDKLEAELRPRTMQRLAPRAAWEFHSRGDVHSKSKEALPK